MTTYATVTYRVQGSGDIKVIGYTTREGTLKAMAQLKQAREQGKIQWASMRVAWQPSKKHQVIEPELDRDQVADNVLGSDETEGEY